MSVHFKQNMSTNIKLKNENRSLLRRYMCISLNHVKNKMLLLPPPYHIKAVSLCVGGGVFVCVCVCVCVCVYGVGGRIMHMYTQVEGVGEGRGCMCVSFLYFSDCSEQ